MKTIHKLAQTFAFITAFTPLMSFGSQAAAALTVAVFEFEAADSKNKEFASQLALLLNTEFAAVDGIWVVERQQLSAILGEQELGVSGMVEPATAARIGHLTGAKVLVMGRIFPVGKDTMITAKIIGTETGRVFGHSSKNAPTVAIDTIARALGKELAAQLKDQAATLIAAPTSSEDRVTALRALVGDKHLPSIRVAIPEQHLTQRVVDPAAQTEIARLLGQLGATILAPESGESPAVLIRGEAFSEAGLRRGNLISCRARVEIEVVETKTGRLLLADRETQVAVDPAESVAAKQALQNAGDALVDRILATLLVHL